MYKKNQNRQITLKDFNQPLGLKLNPENKWIKKAAMIPWEAIEEEYADLFPSGCGMPAKPLRMALGRIEKISFEAYNESEVLIPAIENYYKRNRHYPERVLADKIYKNRINLAYCKERGIRLAGPALGRPGKDTVIDSVDRIEVERKLGLSKHSHGLGLIMTKREDTARSSIVLSIISMNLNSLLRLSLFLKLILIFSRYNCCYILCESIG